MKYSGSGNSFEGRTDEELVELLRSGARELEDYLMNKYKDLVKKKARQFYLEGGDRDDLLQEGMWGLFKAIREYRSDREASFYTFAELCVTRQMYSAITSSKAKKNSVLNESLPISDINEYAAGFEEGPEDRMLALEDEMEFHKRIRAGLSPLELQVLDRYLEGMDGRQIAKDLGRTVKSVDNAMQRIKTKIRKGA